MSNSRILMTISKNNLITNLSTDFETFRLVNGGLILEFFSPWSFSKTNVPNQYPELFHPRLKSWEKSFDTFCWGKNQGEKLYEIKSG